MLPLIRTDDLTLTRAPAGGFTGVYRCRWPGLSSSIDPTVAHELVLKLVVIGEALERTRP